MTILQTQPTPAPQVGDPAPHVAVINLDGEPVELAALWADAPRGLAVVFLRHYGCPYCRLHAQDFQRHAAEFATAGTDVAIVGCGTLDEAEAFAQDLDLTLSLYNDAERQAYAAFGVGQASLGGMLHPQNLTVGISAARQGFLPKRSKGDPRQLQGQFLIDRTGIIRSVARPVVMGDIPTASAVLNDAQSLPEPVTA
jgi:peroxiredoxin